MSQRRLQCGVGMRTISALPLAIAMPPGWETTKPRRYRTNPARQGSSTARALAWQRWSECLLGAAGRPPHHPWSSCARFAWPPQSVSPADGLRKQLARCGLADARLRQLVNRERLEIDTSLCIISGHLRREQRVLAEHSAGFCRVARGSAHCCLGRPCPARRSPQEKAVFAVFARVLAIPM